MNIEEMKRYKYELGLTSEMIAERSKVPLSTVQKIFAGITSNPRLETRLKIERVLLKEKADRYFYSTDDSGASVVRDIVSSIPSIEVTFGMTLTLTFSV